METKIVNVYGVELHVQGIWDGSYYPATHGLPEEFPDFNITAVFVKDSSVDLYNLLTEEQFEIMYEQISY